MSHYCSVSEARGKMPCMEQCTECYSYEHEENEMIMTEQERKEFEMVTRPVIQWLNNNCHPHVSVVIETTGAELCEGVCAYRTNDYIQERGKEKG